MRLVMLGPPGAGKGTQAVVVAKYLEVPHVSTGDMFREAIKNSTPLGKKAKEYIDKGELVPDEVTVGLVRERLSMDDAKKGFVLDGFPRTLTQAVQLDEILEHMNTPLDAVVEVRAEDEEVIKRLENRRSCPACGGIYHLIYNPPVAETLCDRCKKELVQRSDDTREVISNRLEVYHEKTDPLVGYYRDKKILVPVDGTKNIKEVSIEIGEKLGIKSLTKTQV